ncbi:MAG TPA: magnesium transporter [Solirubrobacterales bacterium]|nr:magnesium transporter [Solirubrobacterales bacterium]
MQRAVPARSERSGSPELLDAAAHHATRRVPVASENETAAEVRGGLVGADFDYVEDVAVLDGEELVGLVRLERLLAADAGARVRELMDPDPPRVAPETDQEAAAWKMVAHRESSLAVVDEDGGFRGLIPPYRMLGALLAEHDEDLARLGGYLAGASRARSAAEEPIRERLWHRLPWLLLGLVGAMASALIVGSFEDQLDANVLVAFFIPAIVYMADAVGTQTETVLIRALAAGTTVGAVIVRELLTGVVMGVVIGAAFFAFALAGWGDADIAVAVAVALVASCSIATLVAMWLPALLQRLGRDPAFGSGPLATVIQDLLSIAVYFAVVTAVVT